MGLVHGDVEFLKGFLLGIESSQFSDEEEPVWKELCQLQVRRTRFMIGEV